MYLMQTVSNGRRPGERAMDRRVINSSLTPLDAVPAKLDAHGRTDPYSHAHIDPYHSKIDPYHGNMEPYHGNMEPYHSKIEPYHGKLEPYHGHLASEHARPALATRTHGPAQQEPVYQNQGNFFQLVTPQKFTTRQLPTAPHGGSAFAYKSVQSPNYKADTPLYRVKPAEPAPYKAVETPHYKVKAVETPFYKTKPSEPPPFQAVEKPAFKVKPVETSTPNAVDGGVQAKEEKKRKWTLGGLFRRRKKAAAGESESSSGDDDAPKLGFLARRRSRRDKRKARARGFDVVRTDAGVMSADSLQATPPTVVKATASLGGSHDRLRDSSLSLHSSGGSGSLEGLSRRERRSVIMQRAEALRQHGSSSDEGVDDGSLQRVGSTSRRSRYARTERYIKRLSRDDETVLAREAFDKQRAGWDSEHASTTSPGASPLVRPRHLATASAPTSSPASLERRHHGVNLRPLNVAKAQRGHSPLPPSLGPPATYQPVYANYAPRSLSYDNGIHLNSPRHDSDVHVTCLNTPPEDKVMVVQFPVGRLSHFQPRASAAAPRTAPPPPPPRRYTPVDSRPASFVHGAGSFSSLINAPLATATSRVQRPASVTPEDVHPLPGGRHAIVEKRTVFQYFADQNPRSRKPISIQCHAEQTHGPVEPEARYMSDSQMSRVVTRRPGSHVTDFWRQKDAEAVQAAVVRGSQESLNKVRRGRLGDSSSSLGSDVERTPLTAKMRYLQECLPGETSAKEPAKPVVKMRHSFSNGVDAQPRDTPKTQPPPPPVRRFSRQLSADAVDVSPAGGERKHSTNLEDALDELEAIYKSLKLGDEDLLDRAERRDLPTRFQLRRDDAVDGDLAATLAALPGSMSDSGYDLPRRRGPPTRRSLIPDRVGDDMAYRRLHPKERPASQSFATGSFLLASPALSQSSLDGDPREADAARDDVVYRSVRHVNNALRVAEPQPPFGIPLGPVSPAPPSDYVRARPSERYRPTFAPRRTPDVVGDDLAFRALRKDAKDAVGGSHDVATPSGIHHVALHYRKDKEAGDVGSDALHTARLNDTNFSLRKRRAVRSLSANIPALIGQDKLSVARHGTIDLGGDDGFEKAQSLTHLPDALEIAQKMIEGKEVIGGGTGHLWTTPTPANRNSLAATSTETLTDSRANLTLFQDAVGKRHSWQQKVRVGMPPMRVQEGRALGVEVKMQSEEGAERKSPRRPEVVLSEAGDVETKEFSALNWEGSSVERVLPETRTAEADASASGRSVDAIRQETTADVRDLPGTLTWDAATSKVEGLDDHMMTSSCADDDELLTALAHDARVTSEQLELQLAGMERRLDEISDDSLESPGHPANGHQDDATAPSSEEVQAAQEELAQLHIYESDEAEVVAPPLEEFDDVTEEDEEVQEIFQWENSRQFEANNNAVGGASASTAAKGGAAAEAAEGGGGGGGGEQPACPRRGAIQNTDAASPVNSMSDPSPAPTPPPSASDSSARVARYKEERRRQLASQFSSLATPAADAGASPSPRRFIARARPDDACIKTTRTSRLRAGVEAPAKSPSPHAVVGRGSPRDGSSSSPTSAPRRPAVGRRKASKEGVSPARSVDSVGSTGVRRASREGSPRVIEAKRKVSTSGRGSATSDRESAATATPKDKTSKRMSSLNIGLAHEPTPPADYEQDASVRRRARRGEAPPSEVAAKEPSAKDATRSSPRKEPVAVARRASSKEIVLTRRSSPKEPSPPTEAPPARKTPSREPVLARRASAKEMTAPRVVAARPKEPSPPKEVASTRRVTAKGPSPPKDSSPRRPSPPKELSSPRKLVAKEPSPPKDQPSPRRLVAKEPSPPKDPGSPRRTVTKEVSPSKEPTPTRRLVAKEPSPPKEPASPRRLVAKEPSPPKEPASPRRLVAKEPSPPKEPASPRRVVAKETSPSKEPSSPRRLVAKEPSPLNEQPPSRGLVSKEPCATREPSSPRSLVAVELSSAQETSSSSSRSKEPSPPEELPMPAKSISAMRASRVSPPKELRVEPKMSLGEQKASREELTEARVEALEPRVSKQDFKSTTTAERPLQNEVTSTIHDLPVIGTPTVDRVTSPATLLVDGDPTTRSGSPRVDHPGPVSILKRKTSRDDAAHHPVTFACPEPEQRPHPRRGGILKKHSSLDEAEAARRRSCSPQGVDTKPILKRRSSLEDLVRRAASPESILKRRDEDDDVAATTGILKRKVSGDATSEAEAECGEPRPILKKTSSEEYATAAESSSDSASTTPRPILKLRGEEAGARISKTILKPARKNSGDDRLERRDRRDSEGRYVDEGRYLANRDADADAEGRRRSASPEATLSTAAMDDGDEEPVVVSVADRIRRMESAMRGAVPKRRDNERYKTQPVTRDDFHGLSQSTELVVPSPSSSQHRSQEAMSSHSTPSSEATTPRVFESMAEHVRAMAEEAKARRRDRTASRGVQRHRGGIDQEAKERHQTQPVTLGELQLAGKMNAAQGDEAAMPARAAREAMFEHGQSALRSILKPGGGAAAGAHDDAGADAHKSILKSESAGLSSPAPSTDDDEDGADPEEGSALTTMLNDVASRGKQNGHGEGGGLAAELERKLASRRLVEEFNASRKVNGKSPSTAGKEARDETAALRTTEDDVEKRRGSKSDDKSDEHAKNIRGVKSKPEDEMLEKASSRDRHDDEVKRKTPSTGAKEQDCADAEGDSDTRISRANVEKSSEARTLSKSREEPRAEGKTLRPLGGDVARVAAREEAASSAADTGSDGDSSGGREVKRIIRNEAVARRRQAALAVKHRNGTGGSDSIGNAISKSQSNSALGQHPLGAHPSGDEAKPRGRPGGGAMDLFSAGLKRSQTQPMEVTHDGIKETSSIAERLAALKKSQDTGWQKRLPKLKAEDDLAVVSTNNLLNLVCARGADPLISTTTTTSTPDLAPADSVVADRRGKLDVAAQGWKKRVEPSDAVGFSVAGRMRDVETVASPVVAAGERMKRTPRPNRFRSKASEATASTPVSPLKELSAHARFVRSASAPGGEDAEEEAPRTVVAVPRADNETFTTFFASFSAVTTLELVQSVETSTLTALDLDLDLDAVRRGELPLGAQSRRVRAPTRRHAASRNPLRALAARTDLCHEYVEALTGLADRELRRLQVEKLAKGSNLALEALAGLASKEDFTAVALRKGSPAAHGAMLPHRDLMLLHVKGRRRVQTRLVQPCAASVNSGDSYVLVTPTEVYNWLGLYSNVIERSRSAEIAALVQQRKDLNCSASVVVTITEGKSTASASKMAAFWSLLGATSPAPAPAGHPDEDEAYEASVVDTNMVYTVNERELVPCDEYWGATPRIEMLDPAKVLVFDFGSECYVWCGKTASMADRRAGTQLATELWREGYDYAECDVCPVTAAAEMGSRGGGGGGAKTGERPAWALLAKVTQHMETVLFREKFLDWPDFSRVIRGGPEAEPGAAVEGIDVKPCDASEMWTHQLPEPDLELEGSHLGRGTTYHDEETQRTFVVSTQSVTLWHVDEFERWQLPSGACQLHAGDSFVVRWLYSVTATARELSGAPSKHAAPGRDRCAYFTWQGGAASLNEQGTAALMTVELDSERGTQMRVAQGCEPPAFLRLFGGRLVVHSGRRSETRKVGGWRLYLVRGETELEATLVEAPCSTRQLRSRGCVILSHPSTSRLFVWLGARAAKHARNVARAAAARLRDEPPTEAGFKAGAVVTVTEVVEGKEMNDLYEGMGGSNRQLYHSLLECANPPTGTPRLFHLTSAGDALVATEVGGAYRLPGVANAFPFTQDDLYAASQPALFLLDAGDQLWLWQGWWPELDGLEAQDSADGRGSAAVRWQAERRAAMATSLAYWRASRPTSASPRASIVCAGLEPLAFVNAFVVWTDRDDAAAANMADGRKPAEALRVEDELARLTKTTFPAATLLQRPLPDGVDPTRLELYLDPLHFPDLLHMSKEEFDELPAWKQTKVKKDAGLF